MNITLSLDTALVKKLRKIAVDRDTTLTGMVRKYLEQIAAEETNSVRKRRERERLQESFAKFQFKIGKRNWTRQDLYERS
ncbi:MAG: CopG family transcriptional regulator [Acidobacteria bacterium]|nr:CopG family transcriptional regulator [Acidobacteriota bacterium]MBV9145647.1 CopG family transcriptional regulator [Acidobacteriota bacterium]MBV9435643.1 CopG family transcriptional regulator [Acidobacteriota bacterium]